MALSKRLKDLRIKNGKSLQEVASAVEASKPHIWQLEKGETKNPSMDLLQKLADFYGTTLDFLVQGEETPESHVVFGRKFDHVDEQTKELIVSMAEQIIENKNGK